MDDPQKPEIHDAWPPLDGCGCPDCRRERSRTMPAAVMALLCDGSWPPSQNILRGAIDHYLCGRSDLVGALAEAYRLLAERDDQRFKADMAIAAVANKVPLR